MQQPVKDAPPREIPLDCYLDYNHRKKEPDHTFSSQKVFCQHMEMCTVENCNFVEGDPNRRFFTVGVFLSNKSREWGTASVRVEKSVE